DGHGDAKSISRDETFGADINDDDELMRELLALVTRAARDLRGDGMTARTVAVRIRDFDFKTRRASRTLDGPVISDRVILEVARCGRSVERRVESPRDSLEWDSLHSRSTRQPINSHSSSAKTASSPRPIAIACLRERSIGCARASVTKEFCRRVSSTNAMMQ